MFASLAVELSNVSCRFCWNLSFGLLEALFDFASIDHWNSVGTMHVDGGQQRRRRLRQARRRGQRGVVHQMLQPRGRGASTAADGGSVSAMAKFGGGSDHDESCERVRWLGGAVTRVRRRQPTARAATGGEGGDRRWGRPSRVVLRVGGLAHPWRLDAYAEEGKRSWGDLFAFFCPDPTVARLKSNGLG